jgi:hypothetical protein
MQEYLKEIPDSTGSIGKNCQKQPALYAVFAKLCSAQTIAGHLIHGQWVSF